MLTGAVFAADAATPARTTHELRFAAGNVYVNDKPTGGVVGQHPFGGARASGTNDRAGSADNLRRLDISSHDKQTFVPAHSYFYPHMRST